MGLFDNQFLNVVEWNETRDDVIFWKWANKELKKNSRLVIRPGQDAIFIYNGRIEGIFKDEGNYQIESQIIPFLSTLKGFKFGFNSGLRAEVMFVNIKEFTVNWGTKSAINIPNRELPGGLPIRAFGTFNIRVSDYIVLIDKIAGVKQMFTVGDVQERVLAVLNQLLMKWIVKEGKDMFNLQANSFEIAEGIRTDLDMEMHKIGLSVTGFNISSINYPEEIQAKINKTASFGMVGDLDRYEKVSVIDALGKDGGNTMAASMNAAVGMAMGMNMAGKMTGGAAAPSGGQAVIGQVDGNQSGGNHTVGGQPAGGSSADRPKFCSECGAKIPAAAKFCTECGKKLV